MICITTKLMENPRINFDDLELLRQFNTKCANQWDRTLLEVRAVLLVKLTAFEAELDKICGNAGRVEEEEEEAEENDKVEG